MNILDKFLEVKKLPYILAGVIFLCSLAVLSCFKSAETQLNTLNQAVSFSRMMTKSSDDLTNYARYYVTTKNEQWKTEFNNVLKVRNGELADEKGIVKSFKDRLKEVPFLQTELDTLLKAEQLSNNLAKLEIEAFDWIVLEIAEGNNIDAIKAGLAEAKSKSGNGKPVCILLHTEMGNGVDFMMHTHAWHGKAPNDEQLAKALEQNVETLGDY